MSATKIKPSADQFDAATLEFQLKCLQKRIADAMNSGDDTEIIKVKNYVRKIDRIVGSGGRFEIDVMNDGEISTAKRDSGYVHGLVKFFDARVKSLRQNGLSEVMPIVKEGRGRPAEHVANSDDVTI